MLISFSENGSHQNVYSLATTNHQPIVLNTSNTIPRPTYPVVQRIQQQPQYVPPQQQLSQQPQQYIPQQAAQLPVQQEHFNFTPLDQAPEEIDQDDAKNEDDVEPEDEEQQQPVVEPAAVKVPKPRKARKKKDPNAPPTPLSAYAFFFRETQTKVKAHNPSAKFGDISRSVAAMWEGLNEDEKLVYRNRSAEDHERFVKFFV